VIKPGYEAANSLPSSTDIKTESSYMPILLYMNSCSVQGPLPLPLLHTMLKEWLIVAKNRTRFWTCDMPIRKANKMHHFNFILVKNSACFGQT